MFLGPPYGWLEVPCGAGSRLAARAAGSAGATLDVPGVSAGCCARNCDAVIRRIATHRSICLSNACGVNLTVLVPDRPLNRYGPPRRPGVWLPGKSTLALEFAEHELAPGRYRTPAHCRAGARD